MNTEAASYTIGVIGFERAERRVLRRVVGLAESRQPSFKPFDKSGGGCPHLIMVDADRPSAIQVWHRFRRENAHRASFSPIFVGRDLTDLPCPDPYVLHRPILTTSLFTVLDQAVTEIHGFRPPASIPDGLVALTQYEIDATLQTTTVLAASAGVLPMEPPGSVEMQRTPEVTALVVADSLPVRVQMRGVLTSIASRVDFAETGARALELIDARSYSVIFVDETLPDEDACELPGKIKTRPLQREAVLVMLIDSSLPVDRVMGLLAGFDNYLLKPIQRQLFNELAAELVRPAVAHPMLDVGQSKHGGGCGSA
jgi:two-component system cell cycle response regulator